jgi:hypothetical protein
MVVLSWRSLARWWNQKVDSSPFLVPEDPCLETCCLGCGGVQGLEEPGECSQVARAAAAAG